MKLNILPQHPEHSVYSGENTHQIPYCYSETYSKVHLTPRRLLAILMLRLVDRTPLGVPARVYSLNHSILFME